MGEYRRKALLCILNRSLPAVLKAMGFFPPLALLKSNLSKMLMTMNFDTPLPSLSIMEGKIICTAILISLSRYHLKGINPLIGRAISSRMSCETVRLQIKNELETELLRWGYDRLRLDLLVSIFEGTV